LRSRRRGAIMGVSDARRLEVYEQARAQWGEGPAEALMEMVVPAGQDMATRQDVESSATRVRTDLEASIAELRKEMEVRFARLEERIESLREGAASKEYVLRTFFVGLIPVYAMLIGLLFGMYGR
jgi:predicted  nucleic acid-binding Zn-ribbon protein